MYPRPAGLRLTFFFNGEFLVAGLPGSDRSIRPVRDTLLVDVHDTIPPNLVYF